MAIGPLVPIHEHHLAIFQQWAKVLLASGNVIAENGNKCARSHTRRNLGDGSLVIVDVADTAKSGMVYVVATTVVYRNAVATGQLLEQLGILTRERLTPYKLA